ncbi:serine/threonine-protein kinase [Streptomyces sp. NPDC090022]|uniref:serine/threonine-protein kinase n=1 Tax=Streptomyces sp. NPDC090022 TaxID=3365920 RepID=UPI0038133FC1
MSAPGDVIDGRFELLERLGSGGMGTVWRALDRALHREVAVKEVRSWPGEDDEASRVLRERILREARAQARISHPHVVTVHHIVDQGPHPWLVMELLSGGSLQQRLERGPMRPAEAARLGREVLAGLSAAHAAGIHHRDVKPANVLLRADGSAVLTDFGIAALQDATSLTRTGEIIGTPEFLAPERIRGADTPACDLWSLAMTLYVCVEAVSPMRRTTTLATLAAVLDDPVPPPRRAGALGPVLAEVLVRDPAARPDARRLDALLAAVAAGAPLPAPGPEPFPGPPEPTRVDPAPAPAPAPATPPPPGAPGRPGAPAGAGARSGPPAPPADTPPAVPGPGPYAETPHEALATIGPYAAPPERPRRRTGPFAAGAVLVALLLLGLGIYVLTRPEDTGGSVAQGGGTATTSAPASTPAPDPSRTASPAGSPAAPAPAPPSPAPSPTPTPTPTPTPPPAPDRPGTPAQPAGGSWIAQLHSEPKTSGTAARDQVLAGLRGSVPEAQVLDSSRYASLNPGYWVVYAPGPFTDGRAALSFCAARGRTTANQCIGRWLSNAEDDYRYQCAPPAASPSGQCRRP